MKSVRFVCLFVALGSSMLAAQSNPVPLINEPLVPASTVPGGEGFTLTVNGTGFVSGSVVNWNGVARITNFVNDSQLTATILPSDIASPSTASVAVVNPDTGAVSNISFFQITVPTGSASFVTSNYPLTVGTQGVATGDFNKDGKLDLAINAYDPTLSYVVYVLMGNGDGTFGSTTEYDTTGGDYQGYPVIGDFNGDGNLDIVVTSRTGCCQLGVDVLLGNGDGTFGPPLFSSTTYDANGLMAVGDFNGDGKLDLAVTTSSAISVLLGNGDGTFQSPLYPIGTGRPICVGDFNGDGRLDLAVGGSNGGSDGSLLIYLGNGDGTFQSPMSTMIQPSISGMVTADFNGDGKLDIATTTGVTMNAVTVLLGNGDGTFQKPSYYGTGTEPVWLDYGDFNGDGKLDLVTANQGSNTVSVLLGRGDGTFQTNGDIGVGKTPNAVAAGDFNGDGRRDIAVGNFSSAIFSVLSQTVTFSPPGLNFGNQPVGSTSQAQVTTFTNVLNATLTISSIKVVGANSGDFNQTNDCGASLPPGGGCNISVTFTPSAVGNRVAGVSVSDNAPGSPHIVPLSGIGTQPAVTLSPPSLNFGNQTVGITSSQQISTLTNTGNGTLTITSIVITGTNSGDFAQTNNCPSSLAPTNTCNISVTFTPTATGTRNAAVSITDNAPDSPQSLPLTGVGVLPAVSFSPTSLDFGSQGVGTTGSPQITTLTNTGAGILTIMSIGIKGTNKGNFAQTNNCPSSVEPNGSCQISVTFTPTATGTRNAKVSVADNAPGSPQSVPLTGVGTPPAVTFSPTTLTFPNQVVFSTSPAQPVTLTNTGAGVLKINHISMTGPFRQTNNCPSSLSPGANCTISVKFHPITKGVLHRTVSVKDNAPGSPQKVPLTGTGTFVKLVPTNLNFGSQPVGTRSLAKKVTLTNKGSVTVKINGIMITGNDAGDFAETDTCGKSVAAGASCFIKVAFKPLVKGKRTADVSVYDDGGGSPQKTALAGTGT